MTEDEMNNFSILTKKCGIKMTETWDIDITNF